jgi:hypothetical protein
MEGPQIGHYETRQSVCEFPAEQVRACSSSRATLATPHSRVEMGEYIDGLHHRPT